ncbi:hypothetical protein JCM31185_08920 [Furfurilactobacillus curtus]|uniref:Transposase n=1 Tax=Furfurilactobacillus curtus TaxID=1746200 RepID=A0ABQ5JM89_9LACO
MTKYNYEFKAKIVPNSWSVGQQKQGLSLFEFRLRPCLQLFIFNFLCVDH